MPNRSERRPLSKKTKREKVRHQSLETARTARKKQPGKRTWKAMDRTSTIAAGLIAHRITALTWRAATGRKPPTSTRHPDVSNAEAVTWAVLAGAGIELTKVLIRRGIANYWVKSTGHLPPGMKPLKTADDKKSGKGKPGKDWPADPPVEVSAGKRARKATKKARKA